MKRIGLLDALRGFCVVLMVIYHLVYSLLSFDLVPVQALYNPVMQVLQFVASSLFITISGVSASFSKSNFKRGLRIFAAGLVLTLLTWCINPQGFIVFGILHFLGLAAMLYHVLPKIKLPSLVWILLFFVATMGIDLLNTQINLPHLWIFGLRDSGFASLDYFPLLPYLLLYYFGASLGQWLLLGKGAGWIYTYENPFFAYLGKKAFIIYLLHQPLFIGLISIYVYIFNR